MKLRKNKRESGGETAAERLLRPVAFGTAGGILVTLACFLLFALVMQFQDVPHIMVSPLAVTAAIIGSFFAGFWAARVLKEKGLLVGSICGLLLFVIVFLSGAAAGTLGDGSAMLVKLIAMLPAAALGGMLGVNVRKKRK